MWDENSGEWFMVADHINSSKIKPTLDSYPLTPIMVAHDSMILHP